MSLQIQYSKKIAKELGKVAVNLPGAAIKVGDIVQFPFGKGIFRTAPFGSFTKITDLKGLGVNYDETENLNSPDSYQFSSDGSVNFNVGLKGDLDLNLEDLPSGNGKLQISFSKKGGIFFYAIGCITKRLNNLQNLENEVKDNGKRILWDNTFLVTSLTTAKKALVLQSISKTSYLVLRGDIKNIHPSSSFKLDIEAKINIEKQSGNMLIKDWSDDVTLLIDVMRFKKNTFQKRKEFHTHPLVTNGLKLEPVNLSEYLNILKADRF